MLIIVSLVTTILQLLGKMRLVVCVAIPAIDLITPYQCCVNNNFMESSVPSGKPSQTEPPPSKWGEFWGSAIAIVTLILPVTAIVHYSPASSVQALPTTIPPARLTE
jgi:hypothetical protein